MGIVLPLDAGASRVRAQRLSAVGVFLLIKSMVRHHFFSGGQMNKHDVTER
jgi:hypothetical protein